MTDDKLFQLFMKQNEPFSKFYEKFKEDDGVSNTGDSTSFIGQTPQTIIDPKDIEEEEDSDDEEEEIVKASSFDYKNDDEVIKLGKNKG